MLCRCLEGKTGWVRDLGLHGNTKMLLHGRLVSDEYAGEAVRMEASRGEGCKCRKANRAVLQEHRGQEKHGWVWTRREAAEPTAAVQPPLGPPLLPRPNSAAVAMPSCPHREGPRRTRCPVTGS